MHTLTIICDEMDKRKKPSGTPITTFFAKRSRLGRSIILQMYIPLIIIKCITTTTTTGPDVQSAQGKDNTITS